MQDSNVRWVHLTSITFCTAQHNNNNYSHTHTCYTQVKCTRTFTDNIHHRNLLRSRNTPAHQLQHVYVCFSMLFKQFNYFDANSMPNKTHYTHFRKIRTSNNFGWLTSLREYYSYKTTLTIRVKLCYTTAGNVIPATPTNQTRSLQNWPVNTRVLSLQASETDQSKHEHHHKTSF